MVRDKVKKNLEEMFRNKLVIKYGFTRNLESELATINTI